MDLRGLQIFLAVCETGGLTSAARLLGLTQAGVSQHLSKLERATGVQLVDRSMRPSRPTAAGEFLRGRARKVFADLEDIETGLRRYRDNEIPTLKLGMIESAGRALLPHLVNRLSDRVGSLSVTSGTTHPLVPELLRGEIDMIITTERPEKIEGVDVAPLLTEPLVLCLPKGAPAPRDWDEVGDLARRLQMVRYGRKRRIGRLAEHVLARFEIATHGSLEFDSSLAIFDQVRKGLGWAVTTPLCLYGAGLDPSDVTIAPFPSSTPVRCLNLAWAPEHGAAAELVAQTCRDIFAEFVIPELWKRASAVGDRIQVAA